jgi:hypothetical protein
MTVHLATNIGKVLHEHRSAPLHGTRSGSMSASSSHDLAGAAAPVCKVRSEAIAILGCLVAEAPRNGERYRHILAASRHRAIENANRNP